MEKFLIIDGHSLAYRAFYALPLLTNADGQVTNAIFGFYKTLKKAIAEVEPAYVAVAFDKEGKVFRHQIYDDYKGTRKPIPRDLKTQLPLLKDLLKTMRIAVFEAAGYEADDLIGTLVKFGEQAGFENFIVSGDRDTWQLISKKTKVLLTRSRSSEFEIYDLSRLKKEYDLTPEQIVEVKGLKGDAADNIPGVPGIGQKTALRLIKKYGTVENVLKQRADFQGRKLGEALEKYGQQALLSKKLAIIDTQVPLEFEWTLCQKKEPDQPRFFALLEKLGFKSILKEQELAVETIYEIVKTPVELAAYLESGEGDLILHFEIEKKGVTAWQIKAAGLKFVGQVIKIFPCKELDAYLKVLKPYLEAEDLKKTLWDAKSCILALAGYGIEVRGINQDVLLMAYLLNPARSLKDIDTLAQAELGAKLPQEGVERLPAILNLLEELSPRLLAALAKQDLLGLYQDIELPLVAVLVAMERAGIKLELTVLEEVGRDLKVRIEKLSQEIYKLAGEKFNLNSPKQLAAILFEKLGLPASKKTKTGYSTRAEVLEELAPQYEIAALVLVHRQLTKLQNTYIEGLAALFEPKSKRLYTSFNQTITATGRLSSTEPNLQNIPVRLPEGRRIRKAFLPSKGNLLLAADYSQIELRVLAHLAQDPVMIEAFKANQDIHVRTAAEVFGLPLEMVTPEMRQAAKAVNFGIVYGISDYGLSRDLNIPRAEAKAYIEKYFTRYHGVRDYQKAVVATAKKLGYVTTLLNRRRYLPDLKSRNYHLRNFAQRAAMNTPVQGSAADLIKIAMLNIYQLLNTPKWAGTKLILQVHDELIFDVPKKFLPDFAFLVREVMTGVYPLQVPLQVDLAIGSNWYALEKLGG